MEKRSSDKYPAEVESPFLNQEFFVAESDEELESRSVAVATESPFVDALEESRSRFDESQFEEEDQSEQEKCRPGWGIIGDKDDRVKVNKTWNVPNRWICQISVRKRKNGKLQQFGPAGTGVLISPHYVLTGAHVLRDSKKDKKTGQWIDSDADYVVVTPALNEDAPDDKKRPFGKYEARSWKLSPKYNPRAGDSWRYDYAIIRLKDAPGYKRFPVLNNEPLCYWGHHDYGGNTEFSGVVNAKWLEGVTAYTAGYPFDRGSGKTMWFASGALSGVDLTGRREVMNISADACYGQSGSPVWIVRGRRRCLVGILKKIGTGVANSALQINQEVFDQISKWFEEVKETPEIETQEMLDGQTESTAERP